MYDVNGEIIPPYSNENWLIDPYFVIWNAGSSFALGDSTYAVNSGYTADMWWVRAYGANKVVEKTTNGIKYTATQSGYAMFVQCMETLVNSRKSIPVTVSAKVKGTAGTSCEIGTAYSAYINSSFVYKKHELTGEWQTITFTTTLTTETTPCIVIQAMTGCISFEMEWAKFEQGTINTPFIAPDISKELLRAQRFYELIGSGMWVKAYNTNTCYLACPFRIQKRANPNPVLLLTSATFSGMSADVSVTMTSISTGSAAANIWGLAYLQVVGTLSSGSFVAGKMYSINNNIVAMDSRIYPTMA